MYSHEVIISDLSSETSSAGHLVDDEDDGLLHLPAVLPVLGCVPDARHAFGPVLASPRLTATGCPLGGGARQGAPTLPPDLQLPWGPALDEKLQGAAEPLRPLLRLPHILHSALGAGLAQPAGSDGLPLRGEGGYS